MIIAARAKQLGTVFGSLLIILGMMALGLAFLTGMASFSIWVLEWTFPASLITLAITLVMIIPFSLIPATREMSAIGLLLASAAFSMILWLWCTAYTYGTWGLLGVIAGLFFGGIGIIPVAMLAAVLHGDWGNFFLFIVAALIIFGVRALAHFIANKAEERSARRNPSRAIINP